MDVVTVTENGLYCPPGNFYIDPWRPVACAVLTHAHGVTREPVANDTSLPSRERVCCDNGSGSTLR